MFRLTEQMRQLPNRAGNHSPNDGLIGCIAGRPWTPTDDAGALIIYENNTRAKMKRPPMFKQSGE